MLHGLPEIACWRAPAQTQQAGPTPAYAFDERHPWRRRCLDSSLRRGSPVRRATLISELSQPGSPLTWSLPHNSSQILADGGICLPQPPAVVVFSGGTAINSVAGQLRQLTTHVAHVLPVSDDGGSTAEIARVLGGPAVGDIRSRCLRLADDSDEEACAVKALLAHRLPANDSEAAKLEWYSIVEGDHSLWKGLSGPYKMMIRAFLVHFQHQILSHASARFDFCNGSVGNFFFAGARVFFRSIEAAIFMFHRLARLPEGSLVLPAIVTEERITLGAELHNGTFIRGQNQISHPNSSGQSKHVDKDNADVALPSAIRRVLYLSSEGADMEHEVFPEPNPAMLAVLRDANAIVYGMGSLYTSICPTLCLHGVGEAVAGSTAPKILLLNGSHDRETSTAGSHNGPMDAADFVQAVSDALNRCASGKGKHLDLPPSAYVTNLLVPRGGAVLTNRETLYAMGIQHIVEVDSVIDEQRRVVFEPVALVQALGEVLTVAVQQDEEHLDSTSESAETGCNSNDA